MVGGLGDGLDYESVVGDFTLIKHSLEVHTVLSVYFNQPISKQSQLWSIPPPIKENLQWLNSSFRAAHTTMGQMTICNVIRVDHNDDPEKNY